MSTAGDQPTARNFPDLFLAEQVFILEARKIEEAQERASEQAAAARATDTQSGAARARGVASGESRLEKGQPEPQFISKFRSQAALVECLREVTGRPAQQELSPGDESARSAAAPAAARSARGVTTLPGDTSEQAPGGAAPEAGNPRVRISTARHPGEEPFVSFMSSDQVGLALSGGGIRSATFNLGLLQGLSDLGLLRHIDYLSTVSGGGYIGGWWTAWRNRGGASATEFFPKPDESSNTSVHSHALKTREPEEVRHIRGFSNFLAPRVGVFSTDMWNGVVAIISGLLPSFLMAFSLLSLVLIVFVLASVLFVARPLLHTDLSSILSISAVFAVLTYLILVLLERRHRKRFSRITVPEDLAERFYTVNALSALVLAALLFALTIAMFRPTPPVSAEALTEQSAAAPEAAFLVSGDVTRRADGAAELRAALPEPPETQIVELGDGVDLHVETKATKRAGFVFNSYLMMPVVAWSLTALVLLIFRYQASWTADVKENRKKVSASGRILGRLGKAAIVWSTFVLVWELSRFLLPLQKTGDAMAVSGLAAAMAVAAELFRRASLMLSRESSSKDNPTVLSRLKSLLPQVLAYAVIGLGLIIICFVLRSILDKPGIAGGLSGMGLGLVVCAGVLIVLCRILNPEALGLHAYYRGRLARAYLGASNRGADEIFFAWQNLQTIERPGDDLRLSTLRYPDPKAKDNPRQRPECRRPYHLVCCAANDLSADSVATLGRGSRSAVLSCDGLAIGNHVAPQASLTMASAQTASAAAFNSLMGSKSTVLGPGVSFLMTALNLRLGLWRCHPASGIIKPPAWPGFRVLKEMLGNAAAGFIPSRASLGEANELLQQPDVHLSDGGHFENLGLYELIRRHCRYIIVSDCGADPEVAFDDFGNALRRIREDFNVEIEVDLSPLKPDATGRANQHMVVGTIHYDRRNDKGILLYFKPALTGDEPDDVTQYRTRNRQFPNESTADQFYDEAQWESYRRLGEHASRASLRFIEELATGKHGVSPTVSAQEVFTEAFWHWYPAPADLRETILRMTDRFTGLQEKLRISQQTRLFQEICPEATVFAVSKPEDQPPEIPTQEELQELLPLLLQIMQLMEDAFIGCRLETHASHPMNLGWVNLLYRWANAETFQFWWPIMQPLFSREFRHFLNHHLGLYGQSMVEQPVDDLLRGGLIREAKTSGERTTIRQGYAASRWRLETGSKSDEVDKSQARLFEFRIPLAGSTAGTAAGASVPHVQIAFCSLSVDEQQTPAGGRNVFSWFISDLFVPAGLWGTGIGSQLLRGLLSLLWQEALTQARKDSVEGNEKTPEAEFRVLFNKNGTDQTSSLCNQGTRAAQAPLETDQASRAAHADQIRFYTAAGFELRLDVTAETTRDKDGTILPPPQVLVLELSGRQTSDS